VVVVIGGRSEKPNKDLVLKRGAVAFLSGSQPDKLGEYEKVTRKSKSQCSDLMNKACW